MKSTLDEMREVVYLLPLKFDQGSLGIERLNPDLSKRQREFLFRLHVLIIEEEQKWAGHR